MLAEYEDKENEPHNLHEDLKLEKKRKIIKKKLRNVSGTRR